MSKKMSEKCPKFFFHFFDFFVFSAAYHKMQSSGLPRFLTFLKPPKKDNLVFLKNGHLYFSKKCPKKKITNFCFK